MVVAPSRRPPLSFARDASSLTLEELLGEARESFADELAIPLTVNQPPSLYDVDAAGERVYQATLGAQIGLSMSPQLYRRLGNPADDYGNVFPVARALHDLNGWCRGRHLEGRGGPWLDHLADLTIGPDLQRPLCARLAYQAVVWHMPVAWSAEQERLSLSTAERLLAGALRAMWDKRRDWAHADDSGVAEVLAEQRRERRAARERAEASRAEGVVCRYCAQPYDPDSEKPCPGLVLLDGDSDEPIDTNVDPYRELGMILLCSPAPR